MIPRFDEYKKKHGVLSQDVIDLGLERITDILAKLGHPERTLRIIHVAGTNGKGSTIAFLQSLLTNHGYTTGVFTSPSVIDVHDQIRHDGVLITEREMDALFERVKMIEGIEKLTDFELLTVLALLQFERWDVDYVLLETGLGGKKDSTNIVMPILSVITSIALDHTTLLGDTIEEIAAEKGGIIKKGVPVVVGKMPEEAVDVLYRIAEQQRAPIRMYNREFKAYGESYRGKGHYEWGARLLQGTHQVYNAALAIAGLELLQIPLEQEKVAKAIETATYAYRFEQVREYVWLDGAHNPAAAKALVRTIQEQFGEEVKVDIAFGILARKDVQSVVTILEEVAASLTFIEFEHEEALKREKLSTMKTTIPISVCTVSEIKEKMNEPLKNPLIITGSLYLLQSM